MNKNVTQDPKYGYMRLDPIPSQKEVEEYYAKEFYDANREALNDSALEHQSEQSDFYDSIWSEIHETCKRKFGDSLTGKSLFDIGFGFAQALLYFKKLGLNVAGIEPSPEGAAYAKSKGINAFQTGIENFACTGGERFDIVLIINVLEHLRNPAETVINIKEQLLKKDGVLVIEVPNEFNDFQVTANDEYDLDQWWVVNPNHINYFSVDSLKNLLTSSGYEIFDCYTSFPLEMFILFGDQYVGNGELGRACHNKRVKFEEVLRRHGKHDKLKEFYRALAKLNLGRSTTIYATPK